MTDRYEYWADLLSWSGPSESLDESLYGATAMFEEWASCGSMTASAHLAEKYTIFGDS